MNLSDAQNMLVDYSRLIVKATAYAHEHPPHNKFVARVWKLENIYWSTLDLRFVAEWEMYLGSCDTDYETTHIELADIFPKNLDTTQE